MEGLISVIIPVYKVEKYLDRCVESVVNQTYQNLEIILVDDGSPDLCPQKCDEWARKDPRIRVIHKKNAGLGMARNTGIEEAKGEYICFFDSDDYIALDILQDAYTLAEKENADITFFGMASASNDGTVLVERIPRAPKNVYAGEEVRERFLPDLINESAEDAQIHDLSLSVCACLFRMDLIRRANWRMVSEREIISEDSYSLLVLFQHVNTVAILPKKGYFYCYNPVSQTQTYRTDRYEKIKQFYQKAIQVQQVLGYNDLVKERIGRLYMGFVVGALKQVAAAPESMSVRLGRIRKIVSDEILQQTLRSLRTSDYPWKIRLLCQMLRMRLSYFVFLLANAQAIVGRRG